MNCKILFLAALAALPMCNVRAVENLSTSTYNLTAPTDTDIASWGSGWTQPASQPTGYTSTTGWNYVGRLGNGSGTYIGRGWVLTAAHIGAGLFLLNGVNYPVVPNTAVQIGSTDLELFKVSPSPALPPLLIRSSDPVAASSHVAIIGCGAANSDRDETWGYDLATQINLSVALDAYVTNEFIALIGSSSTGKDDYGNVYSVVTGDSGGGVFIRNASTGLWELAGINEINGEVTYNDQSTQQFSGFMQLNTYAAQIQAIANPAPTGVADTPAMPAWALVCWRPPSVEWRCGDCTRLEGWLRRALDVGCGTSQFSGREFSRH